MMKRGDVIINPLTQRPVKIGSRTYITLVKKGVIEPTQYIDPVLDNGDPVDEDTQEVVQGRGRYKGKKVVRNKPMRPKRAPDVPEQKYCEMDNQDSQDNQDNQETDVETDVEKEDSEDADSVDDELERLIMEELASCIKPAKRRIGKPPGKANVPRYNLVQFENEYSSDDDSI